MTVSERKLIEQIYEKDKKLKPEDVNNLKRWVETQGHLPKISGK